MKNRNISLVVAVDKDNGIGVNNKLLCYLPDDLKYFKEITTGHTVIMGRRTFDSIGKPLPNRENIILSRNTTLNLSGCKVINSIPYLLETLPKSEEVFIIGGQSIYMQTITYASKIYLTRINHEFDADSFFPALNTEKDWKIIKTVKHDIDEKHPYSFSFLTYERKSASQNTHISQHLIDF